MTNSQSNPNSLNPNWALGFGSFIGHWGLGIGHSKKGFTFVELIVVIAVIAILTLISIPYYGSIKKNLALERSVVRLVQDIRRAQEMSLSGQSPTPYGGYGVYLSKNGADYVIFKDNGSMLIAPDKQCQNNCGSGSSEKIETIALESNIKISSLENNNNKIHLIFLPPDPIVYFTDHNGNELGASFSMATIRISLVDDASKYRNIKINRAGLIWVE